MKTQMFSVFDSKAAVFGVPFFMPREAAAIRAFSDLSNDKSTSVGMHPEDYTLYHVGDYDDETAHVETFKPRALVTASAVVKHSIPVGPANLEQLTDDTAKKLKSNGRLSEVK